MMINTRNRLLLSLDDAALSALAPVSVPLALRQRLDIEGPAETVYFIEDGVASVIADVDGKMAVELGIVGREGMVGLGVVYRDDENPFVTLMQVEGTAFAVEAGRLRSLMDERSDVQNVMLRFARAFSIQVASTAPWQTAGPSWTSDWHAGCSWWATGPA
jgi:hypothetical protein